jgi:hypothetical protein
MVYVFNCSEQMDYKSCGNIYKGLAQTGKWVIFNIIIFIFFSLRCLGMFRWIQSNFSRSTFCYCCTSENNSSKTIYFFNIWKQYFLFQLGCNSRKENTIFIYGWRYSS